MASFRSYLLEVSDRDGHLLDRFLAPVEGAALFVNQLFALLPGAGVGLSEPWFRLAPRRLATGPLSDPTLTPPPLRTSPPIELVADPADPTRAISVTLYDLERQIYQGDYATVTVFGPLVTYLLLARIATGQYAADRGPFRLRVSPQRERGDMQVFDLLPEDAPVQGVFPLPAPRRRGQRTSFQLVTQHAYEERAAASFPLRQTFKGALGGQHRLLWRPAAYEAILRTQPVSEQVEVGGYLVGQVFRDPDLPGRLHVEVREVVAAEGTSASMALLRFTADSWSALRRRLAGDPGGQRLVGWWHTHLFPATDGFGLSGLDETLHRLYFPSPWHFAALLNVSPEQGRVLRCYQPDESGVLAESAFDLIEEI